MKARHTRCEEECESDSAIKVANSNSKMKCAFGSKVMEDLEKRTTEPEEADEM
jgi:hypothetical protein